MKSLATHITDQRVLNLSRTQALRWCIVITVGAMIVELLAGYWTGSLMLYSDGLHMLSHAASLGVSLLVIILARKHGDHRIEWKGALINGIGLIGFSVYILYESYQRFQHPEIIAVGDTLLVAIMGLLVNLLTAFILGASGIEDLNTKSAFLHMLADTMSSMAIIVGAVIISFTDWFWVDALLSAIIAVVVGKWALGLLLDVRSHYLT